MRKATAISLVAFRFYSTSQEVIRLPCPHFNIKIVQRSKGQSAVAAAAYQSGNRLFCEYDQKTKHYRNKKEVVFSTIIAPPHVPSELTNRNALWNSVEASEKRYDAQLARRVVMALPKEISQEEQIKLVQEYCQAQFVSKGMIADFAIHDKGDGNPHAHILLTMRPVDENGKWLPKSRMIYDLDENGQKQKTAKGNWKCHKEPTIDWNDRKYAEIWRHEWESIVNLYYAKNNREERIDLRSYERQGIDKVPTVHMGPAVTQMEKRGVQTNVGNLNRDIAAFNSQRRWLRRSIATVSRQLDDLHQKQADASLMAFPFDRPRDLIDMLWVYHDIRSSERLSWSRYAQRQGTLKDLHALSKMICWLQENKVNSLERFDECFEQLKGETKAVTDAIDTMERERRNLETRHKHTISRKNYRPIFEQYVGKVFKASKERFAEEHCEELDKYRAAVRYFKAHPDYDGIEASVLVEKHKELKAAIAKENEKLAALKERIEPFSRIAYYISQACKPRPNVDEPDGREGQAVVQNDRRTQIEPVPSVMSQKRRKHDLSL